MATWSLEVPSGSVALKISVASTLPQRCGTWLAGFHCSVLPWPMTFVVLPTLTDQVPVSVPASGSVAVPWSVTTSFGSSCSASLGLRIVTNGGDWAGGLSTCSVTVWDVHAPCASVAFSVTHVVAFRGGGIDGPGFGIAIGADDKVWATSLRAKTISVFDRKTGEPLSPDTGYDFGGRLGSMQGIITTPNGDVWALDTEESQIVHLPEGDAAKGRILGRTVDDKPVDGTLQVKGPFHLAVDQQDRIWVTNSSDTVTRFPADDPGKAEQIKVGFRPARRGDRQPRQRLGRQLPRPSGYEGEAGVSQERAQIEG